jgi:hypothetical protein
MGKLRRYPATESWRHYTYTSPVVFTAASETTSPQLSLDGLSWFLCLALYATFGGTFTTLLRKNSKSYMNNPVNNANLWGTRELPHWLPQPILMPPSEAFYLDLVNGATAPNTIQLAFLGIRVYDRTAGESLLRRTADGRTLANPQEYYAYATNKVLTASQRTPVSFQTNAGGDFIARNLIATSTGVFQTRITDSGGDRGYWDDNLVNKANLWGTASYPGEIHPARIKSNATVTYDVKDTSVAGNTLQLVMEGYQEQG